MDNMADGDICHNVDAVVGDHLVLMAGLSMAPILLMLSLRRLSKQRTLLNKAWAAKVSFLVWAA